MGALLVEKDEELPRWDLSDLYASPESVTLQEDKAWLLEFAQHFVTQYQGNVVALDADALAQAIKEFEELQDKIGKVVSYADLFFSVQTTDPYTTKHYQNLQDFVNEIASSLVFFTLEINQLEEANLANMLDKNATLQHFAPWLRDVRYYRPYQLEEKLEKLLIDKHNAANGAWIRLYEDICNRMVIEVEGQSLTLPQALDLLSDPLQQTRKAAACALSHSFSERADTFTLIYNTLIKDKQVEDKWRGFARPVSARNVANMVEDDVVDTLIETVRTNYAALSQRYYRWKAKKLGQTQLAFWDRNAPLPRDNDETISWVQSKDIVLGAYREFSSTMADIAEEFFTRGWIDAPVVAGKTSGAFSHPTVPSAHPYILLNHQGKMRDVMTLAHELGHGVHQMLSRPCGALMADTPLTLAETASVFGEQLTFNYILAQETSPEKRQHIIAGKVEDMLNTVVRQVAFYQFEEAIHAARVEGELTAEEISGLWMKLQAESFGDAIVLDDIYHPFWMYISHFFHTPFYVYAYAFGDCLVNSLYAVYTERKAAGQGAAFEQDYLDMLRAGGTLHHKELLAPFGIDIVQPDFWQKGLNHIAALIDMLDA
jgi:oligoendopeptidase F